MRPRLAVLLVVLAASFGAAWASGTFGDLWGRVARVVGLRGQPLPASPAVLSEYDVDRLDELPAQAQAALLLERAANGYDGALEEIESRLDSWRGEISLSGKLAHTAETAWNANDLRVRAAAVETYLVAHGTAKTPWDAQWWMNRAQDEPDWRGFAIQTLGLLGNRDVERGEILLFVQPYLDDPDAAVRTKATDALAAIGTPEVVAPLLEVLHDDDSPAVRERAACGLAQSGMLQAEQRLLAAPWLIDFADDGRLDPQTRRWTFQALRDVSGQTLGDDAGEWRAWWADRPVELQQRADALDVRLGLLRGRRADVRRLAAPRHLEASAGGPAPAARVRFDWSPVDGASSYTVYAECRPAADPWKGTGAYRSGLDRAAVELAWPPGPGRCRWRVRADGAGGPAGRWSDWSVVR